MLHTLRSRDITILAIVLASLLGASTSHALWITNFSVADTSLMEIAPDNSNGGQPFVMAGRTQNNPRVRALYRFDLTALPTNTVVLGGIFRFDCTGQSSEPMCVTNSTMGLHRMLRAWGEGTNAPIINPGQGAPAEPGDATWNHAFYPTNGWSTPGGLSDVDFAASESSFALVSTPNLTYAFESTPEFVEDLQMWVKYPALNFGWMIIGAEDVICTAKRLNSCEDPNSKPQLEIELFVVPRFDSTQLVGNQFQMRFTPWPGQNYEVQYRTNLSNANWQTLTNVGLANSATQILVSDSVTAAPRFYRLSAF
jgi:hypothetical protein